MIDFVNEFYQFSKNLQERYIGFCDFILSCITNEDINKFENMKKVYGILEKDTFNIFEPLENYQKEDFNDIILTQILDPNTKEIGNIEFLNVFCKLLSEKTECHFENDVVIEKQIGDMEYGFIDLLISDKQNAIIVENKINGAPDQPNQLVRYYKYVKEKLKKKILGIVYIRPIYDENKMPPLELYDKKFNTQTVEVKNILVPVSVISTKQEKDLCHDFLDVCSCIAAKQKKEKAKLYIQQYSELLKLKGGSKMLDSIKKEMFKKLYSDAESVKRTQAITEILDNRWEILTSIIKDSLYQKGFDSSDDGDEHCTAKSIKGIDEKIYVVFTDYENNKWGFGFWYQEGTTKKVQETLEKLLKNYKHELLSVDVEKSDNWFIGKTFNFEIDKPINDFVDTVHEMYKELEKMAISALK